MRLAESDPLAPRLFRLDLTRSICDRFAAVRRSCRLAYSPDDVQDSGPAHARSQGIGEHHDA